MVAAIEEFLWVFGNFEGAQEQFERSLALYRELDYQPGIAMVLRRLGHYSYHGKRDHLKARTYYQESLRIWRSLGNLTGIALGLYQLGRVTSKRGDFDEAREYLRGKLGTLQGVE